jgi:hypothetical protein
MAPAVALPPFTSKIATLLAFTPATLALAVALGVVIAETDVVLAEPDTDIVPAVAVVLTALAIIWLISIVVPPVTLIAPPVTAVECVRVIDTAPVAALVLPIVIAPVVAPAEFTVTELPPEMLIAAAAWALSDKVTAVVVAAVIPAAVPPTSDTFRLVKPDQAETFPATVAALVRLAI